VPCPKPTETKEYYVAAIGYATRDVQGEQEKLELGERHQFLFYNDDGQRERAKMSVLH
jgi:hypothetical protein